jgi:hypothetical protein
MSPQEGGFQIPPQAQWWVGLALHSALGKVELSFCFFVFLMLQVRKQGQLNPLSAGCFQMVIAKIFSFSLLTGI